MSGYAYIAAGKMKLKLGESPVHEIDSKFGNSLRQRAQDIQNRNAWKREGTGAQFMLRGAALWGTNAADGENMRLAVTGLCCGCAPDEFFYTLETPEVGGVFSLRDSARQEQRLLHTSDYRLSQIHALPGKDRLTCVVRHKTGNSSIAVMRSDCSELAEATQGDSIDLAPRWVPGTEDAQGKVVFQSAGIARNAQGMAAGRSPFSIQMLTLQDGEVTSLVEDAERDLLAPQMDAEGALYYIRKPYEKPEVKINWLRAALDFLLFPFRLLYALFHFLNFFSARYSGKTLITSGAAKQQEMDLKRMMVYGNMVNASEALKGQSGETAPDLVPKSWELVRQAPDGSCTILAKSVLSFDVCADASVLYTNGSAVFKLEPNGQSSQLQRDAFIEQVVAIP